MTAETLTPVAAEALAKYHPTDAAIAEIRETCMAIRVEGVEDKAGAQKAHDARMVVRKHRTDIEKTRVALKADALEFGRKVDAEAKRLTAMLEPIEAHLQEQEDIVAKEAERQRVAEEARRMDLLRERMRALAAVRSALIPQDVARMTDEQFAAALAEATSLRAQEQAAEEKAAAERKAEADRLAAERAELERQRKAQEEAARAEQERLDAQRAEQEALLAQQRRAQEAEAARVRESQAAEAKRIADERAAIEAEKAERARQEELRAAEERAAAAERERLRVEAERAEAERVRREAMRPTVERLQALAVEVESLSALIPEFPAAVEVEQVLARAAGEIRAIAAR